MDKTCEMNYKVVDSPLGEIEISACEQGVHEIRLHGGKTPDAGAVEAPPLPELLGCPGEMTAPLKQCVAWLDAYFHEPAALKDLPLPAIHHPVFQRASHPHPVPQSGLQQWSRGQLLRRPGHEGVASRPRGPPGREAELSGRLPWGWHPPPPACWRNGGLVGVNT
nr:methylated-DNA--protein-cysteine methyltransferase isoform X2 [Panthera onca]XP_060497171.1 methylated-DNA--protein-cysteine methyltransferase isoform X2 [Panthera onca]